MRDEIPNDLDSLDILHDIFKWIPNRDQIRPNFQTLSAKYDFMDKVGLEWFSLTDCLSHLVFKKEYVMFQGKKCIFENTISNDEIDVVLQESMFPYRQTENGFHYVLWFSTDREQTYETVQKILESKIDKHINFAWYINPKPSVLDFYHVQVFTDQKLSKTN